MAFSAAVSTVQLLRPTTALAACWWLLFAIAANISVIVLWLILPTDKSAPLSYAGYGACVLLLTPLIAILGARKPGHRAWPWFVVLPLCIVLQWPSLSQLAAGGFSAPLEVPVPTLAGFTLVLVMGAGNYFGTRHTVIAVLGGCGVLLSVLPYAEFAMASAMMLCLRPLGLCLAGFAAWRFAASVRQQPPWESLTAAEQWLLFRDLFGIVWAKRVMDRVNQLAAREKLTQHLTLDGFVHANSGEAVSAAQSVRISQLLAWVQKRFFDESLLRHNLPQPATADHQPASPAKPTA